MPMLRVPKDYKARVGKGWTIDTLSELTRQTLWYDAVHPARKMEPAVLYREFEKAVALGLAKKQSEGDLHIYHYSQAVQVNPTFWTKEVLLARGIILRASEQSDGTMDCQVVATPWPKFFNYQQDGITIQELTERMVGWEVTNKMDGSLGLVFYDPVGCTWRCVTKGSFSSEQGVWATKFIHQNVELSGLVEGSTYLVEIIYIENTIVIPYDYEGLVLLGAFREDGTEMRHAELQQVWEHTQNHNQNRARTGFRLVDAFQFDSMAQLKEDVAGWDGRKFEGVVIRCIFANGASHRIKVKGDHYKALHRVCTGITPKIILAALASSESELDHLRNDTPEEFIEWFDGHVLRFRSQAEAAAKSVIDAANYIREMGYTNKGEVGRWLKSRDADAEGKVTRSDGTQLIFSKRVLGLVFSAFDDVDAFDAAWRQEERPKKANMARDKIFRFCTVDKGISAAMERNFSSLRIKSETTFKSQTRHQADKYNKCEKEIAEMQEVVEAAAPPTAQVVLKRQLSGEGRTLLKENLAQECT